LQPRAVAGLARALRQTPPLQSGELSDFIRGRLTANASGPGRLSAGSVLMRAGFDRAPKVHHQLAQLVAPTGQRSPEQQTIAVIARCFRLSMARSAIYAPSEFFDVHAGAQAKTQPKLFGSAIGKVAALFKGLAETPFDNRRSMFDVTTVMVAS